MTARLDYWKSVLTGDLRGFADRGTEPRFEDAENMLRVVWQVRGQQREAVFSLMPGNRLRWTPESGSATDMPYYAFLASESMAGFQPLASACIATIPSQVDFLASEAVLDDGLGTHATRLTPQALTDLIEEARRQAETASTQLFFLKGDAGAGKTTLLRETTVLQARRYLAGESEFLCLYVPAQGRELSNLRDAFAGELGDLRAAFTQDAIASLAREGILVPVIDGFDELLGTAGYGGAFSSLQAFLAELDGFGTLIVSARSAFYDIEFLRRSGSRGADGDMRIATAQIQPWSDQQLDEYLTRNREPDDADRTRAELAKLTAADRELLTRPFFASQFDSFLANPDRASGDLLEHLISAYIAREAGKIVDSNGDPVLTADGHCYLFELAVREMWESEVRQLSESDLKSDRRARCRGVPPRLRPDQAPGDQGDQLRRLPPTPGRPRLPGHLRLRARGLLRSLPRAGDAPPDGRLASGRARVSARPGRHLRRRCPRHRPRPRRGAHARSLAAAMRRWRRVRQPQTEPRQPRARLRPRHPAALRRHHPAPVLRRPPLRTGRASRTSASTSASSPTSTSPPPSSPAARLSSFHLRRHPPGRRLAGRDRGSAPRPEHPPRPSRPARRRL